MHVLRMPKHTHMDRAATLILLLFCCREDSSTQTQYPAICASSAFTGDDGLTEAWCHGSFDSLVKCCLQIVDASILKQYIFQKGFITEAAKAKREAEAQNATLQVSKIPPTVMCQPCPSSSLNVHRLIELRALQNADHCAVAVRLERDEM